MWVLIYLCLTRKGPGGVRRDELAFDATLDDTTKPVQTIVYCFFDTKDRNLLASSKSGLFQDPGDMEDYIISQFHPYFDALKPLVSEWWRILQRSYRFSEFTIIHDLFLAAIEKAIKGLQSTPPSSDTAGTKQELDRRCADLNQLLTLGAEAAGPSSTDTVPWAVSPERVTKSVGSYRLDAIGSAEPPSSPSS